MKRGGQHGSDTNGNRLDGVRTDRADSGKVSGRPIVRGTRILPEAIVDSYDLGESIEELQEGFPALSIAQIKRLIEFAHAQQEQPRS